eukprot:174834_1
MSTGIDYSKWDKMVAEMSSSEEEDPYPQVLPSTDTNTNNNEIDFDYDENLSSKHAKVAKLKKPSSVTIGPQGVTINPTKKCKKPNTSLHQSISCSLSLLLTTWTHNGGIHNFDYLWSQTADELVVRFFVPITTRGKHVKIGFNAKEKSFLCNIITNGNKWNINKTFSRKLKESIEEDAKLDWELCNVDVFNFDEIKLKQTLCNILCIENDKQINKMCIEYVNRLSNCRFLKILLDKEKINNNIIEWWDNVFLNDTTIDLKKRIKDRKTDANKMNDIWSKAHEQFKKKVANIKPQEIFVPEDDDT